MINFVSDMKTSGEGHSLKQVLLLFSLTVAALKSGQWVFAGAGYKEYFQAYAALLFLVVPHIFIRIRHYDASILKLRFDQCLKDLSAAVRIGFPVIGSYIIARILYGKFLMGEPIDLSINTGIILAATGQLFAVALPEELFFRGLCQGLLERRNAESWKTGVKAISEIPIILPSALFAAAHFITEPQFYRLATFFPAMLFGYLRRKNDSILPCILIHAAANVAVYLF